jgi:hypothetical protein
MSRTPECLAKGHVWVAPASQEYLKCNRKGCKALKRVDPKTGKEIAKCPETPTTPA